ncbi:SulP family inorganic anion transporter [Agathobaculum sp. NSJ-28]|uniref:SulP family inorganic anion transporter n=2 Tax=Agathobaculum TaxID=2048137 RepID=A0A923LY26_9FIRM|nr:MULTISPECIES: SulP family inorganic anion transporter [Butyricicoccaceae]MBC5726501.1 SulP family inorganic anion transporter [Agathobaculum faecis]MCU6790182.1 SulP family inorganic anion transporter [Agathobaculum ammoniilyticum]WOC75795.1 SulP family inorganic anion transporter [Intestinibacillus sp. NTUH-41-i26]SCJ53385.1 Putative sulfate transporter ychM [uncultured Butyricicoccus sp.]
MGKAFLQQLRNEFRGYNGHKLSQDLMAGLTVAAVALPLALAFGVSAGATAACGLVTAIVAGLVISALTGGYYQISGPTGAMAAILGSLIGTYGMQGMFVATFLAGIMLLIAAVLHLGNLTAFVPAPVITGFTSGIAVIIAMGQIDNFFGTYSEGGSALAKLASYGTLGFRPDLATTAVALFVTVLMVVFPKKWNAVVPASLIGIILATAATMLLGLDIATVGEIPQTLLLPDRLSPRAVDWSAVPALLAPAFSIAVLNMLESLLCGASAGRATGVRLNNDQELFAQGVGNLVLPLFGGIPATAALARTSVAVRSGAQTRLTGVFHAVGLLIMMFALAPVIRNVPLAALAGVLMVTAWRMNEWHAIRYMFSHRFKGAIAKFAVTMVCTIMFDLTVAIVVGVGLGLILMVARLSKLQINYERVDMSRLKNDDPVLNARYSNAMVAYITGPLLFANISVLEELPDRVAGCDTLLLSMRGVPTVDVSAAQTLQAILESFRERGVDVAICGLPTASMTMLRRAGIVELMGEQAFYWSVERALLDPRPRPENAQTVQRV